MSDSTEIETRPRKDGRRLRSEASRSKIVQAMIELIRESGGMGLPPAEMVAERAGVGLRTVFRLFEDMDGVYRAMQGVITAQFAHIIEPLPHSGDWRTDLRAEIARRAELYEGILALQIAADSARHRSPALREGRARLVLQLREAIRSVAPPERMSDRRRAAAVELAVSFEAWRRLRTDQGAPPDEAQEIMTWMALQLLEGEGA